MSGHLNANEKQAIYNPIYSLITFFTQQCFMANHMADLITPLVSCDSVLWLIRTYTGKHVYHYDCVYVYQGRGSQLLMSLFHKPLAHMLLCTFILCLPAAAVCVFSGKVPW